MRITEDKQHPVDCKHKRAKREKVSSYTCILTPSLVAVECSPGRLVPSLVQESFVHYLMDTVHVVKYFKLIIVATLWVMLTIAYPPCGDLSNVNMVKVDL